MIKCGKDCSYLSDGCLKNDKLFPIFAKSLFNTLLKGAFLDKSEHVGIQKWKQSDCFCSLPANILSVQIRTRGRRYRCP